MKKKDAYLEKRGNVYWCDFTYKGTRHREGLHSNKTIALERLKLWKHELKNSKYTPTDWNGFKEKYLEYCKTNKKEKTFLRDELSIRYFDEFTKIKDLHEITPEMLNLFKHYLIKQGKKANNLNRIISSIKAMLRKAEDDDIIESHKWSKVKKLPVAKGKIDFYTSEELKILLENINDTWKLIVLLGARAGLRRGEIFNLQWSDIDFNRNLISIVQKNDWSPKTYQSRYVPISEDLLILLKKYADNKKEEYIIKNKSGHKFDLDVATAYFIKIIKKLNLRGSLHTLRHTFASHLAQAGESLYTISKLLGHTSIQTTEIYAHLCQNTYQTAINKLPEIK